MKKNYVLPWKFIVGKENKINYKTAIIVHLHYEDLLDKIFSYLEHVPEGIDVYITTSNKVLNKKVVCIIEDKGLSGFKILEKKNRGRDISSLLVTCRDFLLDYEYLCFIHDKKSNQMVSPVDGEQFMDNMWENLLKSREYICNVINCFLEEDKLGVLSPPVSFRGEYLGVFENPWTSNYENTCMLAEKLKLEKNITYDKLPITIGSSFWCRTKALVQLFQYKFMYEDFPEEPLATDGTLGHSIERILMYVAENNGFITANVLNTDYAAERLGDLETHFRQAVRVIKRDKLLFEADMIETCTDKTKEILEYCKESKYRYVFGTGTYGKYIAKMLENNGIFIDGFIVTTKASYDLEDGVKVYTLTEIQRETSDCVIIVAMNRQYQEQVKKSIEQFGYKKVYYVP